MIIALLLELVYWTYESQDSLSEQGIDIKSMLVNARSSEGASSTAFAIKAAQLLQRLFPYYTLLTLYGEQVTLVNFFCACTS
ncbi:MAG: hypothetical protein ACSLEM_02735 [Candidatus Malihini olakiniferum]